jgi:hypothetical protein
MVHFGRRQVAAAVLAHMPLGSFAANAAWLALAAIAHTLTRATGCLANLFHARALPHQARPQRSQWKRWADQQYKHAHRYIT